MPWRRRMLPTVSSWPSSSIALPIGPFEPDQLFVPPKQRRRLHDPNSVSHLLDRAPYLGFQLGPSTTHVSFSPLDRCGARSCLRS